jgi:hypothetical protein
MQEERSLSDIATSCEYHTPEATCLAVAENPKAKANRQQRCQNDNKQTCCYTCSQKRECTISCKYLGTTENQPKPQETPKPQPTAPTPEPKTAPLANTAKNVPVAYCTSCNIEMTPRKAKLKLDSAEDNQPKQFGEFTPQIEDTLAVIVYLCPLCGRIEFRASK